MASVILLLVVYILMKSSYSAANVALNKPAYQTGVFGRGTADKAVDGQLDNNTGKLYLDVCAYPDTNFRGKGPALWWVDLTVTYSISTVTVYNTYQIIASKWLNHFTVEVGSSDNTTVHSCGEYNRAEPVNRGDSYTFNCNNKQGRYVYVRKLPGYVRQQLIVLCEVIVLATTTNTAITTTTAQRTPDTTGTTTTTTTTTTTATASPTTPTTSAQRTSVTTGTTTTTTTTTTTATASITLTPNFNVNELYTGEKSISTSPWIISAVVACVVIIILVTVGIYCLRLKQTNHVTEPTNQSTLDQTMSSYGSSSANIIPDQQPVNTSNMNQIGFDNGYLTPVGQINIQSESKGANGEYEYLDDQVSIFIKNTPVKTAS